jgi:hypothetical protein
LGLLEKVSVVIGIVVGILVLITFLFEDLPMLVRILLIVSFIAAIIIVILAHYNYIPSVNDKRTKKEALTISNLERATIDSITLTGFGENAERFTGNVWTITVTNNLQNALTNCRAEMRIFQQNRDTGIVAPLLWRTPGRLPNSCRYPSTLLQTREHYASKLSFLYIGQLFKVGINSVVIPKKSDSEILLLFTFNESQSANIITPTLRQMLTEDTVVSIPFNDLNDCSFLISFYADQDINSEGARFRLEVETWNDINLIQL